MRRREVMGLGRVLRDVVQLPAVLGERRVGIVVRVVARDSHRVERHRLPPAVIDGAACELLVVLGLAVLRGTRIRERRPERAPRDRLLGDPVEHRGHVDATHVEDRGGHVDGMRVLRPDGAGVRDLLERDDQRVADPALVRLALPPAERRVARVRPPPRVVPVGAGPAEIVDARHGRSCIVVDAVEDEVLVERAVRATLRARTVVGERDHEGVVELGACLEELEQTTELVVGVRQEPGEHLHHARGEPSLVGREPLPVGHP